MIRLTRPQCPNPQSLIDRDYNHRDNKVALRRSTSDKCMYCESDVTTTQYGDIEHFRPKSRYPELEFDWNNLGFACRTCNHKKLAKFDEDTPYIDPYSENPNEFFVFFGPLIRPLHASERAALTINDIGLNRPELIEKRNEKISEIDAFIGTWATKTNQTLKDNARQALINLCKGKNEFSMLVKSYLKAQEIIQ